MADVTINYNGSTISEMSASGTKALLTRGKFCEDDIEVVYAKPSASSYTKLAEAEFTVNTTSTSATSVGAINISPASDLWRSDAIILVSVRDKAGKRSGYFLGCDIYFTNPIPANSGSETNIVSGSVAKVLYNVSSSGDYVQASQAYGVFPYDINSSGRVRIYSRYHSTYSLTINGTYKVEVYALQFPGNASPFV